MWDPDPGQDQEAGVADDQVEVALSGEAVPADEAVARLAGPGGGAHAEESEEEAVGFDEVAQLGAGQGGVAEVVVAGDELVPAPGLGVAPGALEEGAEADLAEIAQADLERRRRYRLRGRRQGQRWLPLPLVGGGSRRRPSRSMRSRATRADISLGCPVGPRQPSSSQSRRAMAIRVGSSRQRLARRASSAFVNGRPQ
jgi:hypothetical protein